VFKCPIYLGVQQKDSMSSSSPKIQAGRNYIEKKTFNFTRENYDEEMCG